MCDIKFVKPTNSIYLFISRIFHYVTVSIVSLNWRILLLAFASDQIEYNSGSIGRNCSTFQFRNGMIFFYYIGYASNYIITIKNKNFINNMSINEHYMLCNRFYLFILYKIKIKKIEKIITMNFSKTSWNNWMNVNNNVTRPIKFRIFIFSIWNLSLVTNL